jgi:hypothetical protein
LPVLDKLQSYQKRGALSVLRGSSGISVVAGVGIEFPHACHHGKNPGELENVAVEVRKR